MAHVLKVYWASYNLMVLSHMWAKFDITNLKTHRVQYKFFSYFFSGHRVSFAGYRSHINVHALLDFEEHGVLFYAINPQVLIKTQSADVQIPADLRNNWTKFFSATDPYISDLFNVLYFVKMTTRVYHFSFPLTNIESTFRRSGLCPVQVPNLSTTFAKLSKAKGP